MITLLSGENSFAVSREMNRLKQEFAGDAELIDGSELDAKRVPDLFMGATLFSPERLVIIRDLSSNKSVWADLEDWLERASDDTHLVFVETKPDKRTRTYKWLQKHASVRDFGLVKDRALTEWVQTEARTLGINLDASSANFLISHAGADQWQLYHELQKLALTGKPITAQLIREVVPESGEASAFAVLDDAFAGRRDALDTQLQTLRLREEPYRFFGLLSNQVYVLAAASVSSGSSAELAKTIGVHPFVAQKSQALARQLGEEKVKDIVGHIARLDIDLKSLGGDPWVLIESALRTLPTK